MSTAFNFHKYCNVIVYICISWPHLFIITNVSFIEKKKEKRKKKVDT